MLKFHVNGKLGAFELNLPTSISELTEDFLTNVTSHIHVTEDYSLIGIVYKESLSRILLSNNRKDKSITTSVIPIFIKSRTTDNNSIFNKMNIGDKIIIAPSDIALGHHVTSPANGITINNIVRLCEGDTTAYQRSLTDTTPCCFIEFKLVPNCNIHGFYKQPVVYLTEFIKPSKPVDTGIAD